MTLNAARCLALMLVCLPNLAFATRYRIDPIARTPSAAEAFATDPFSQINEVANMLASASRSLTLMNFIADSDPDYTEGKDFPGYDRRGQFGTWVKDADHCHNTRADILIRDSSTPVTYSERNPCSVAGGRWHDPYTGTEFDRATEVQIDHIVPLKNAYDAGAWKWTNQQRCTYANFTAYDSHLLTVSAVENMRKGDSSPDKYLPPDESIICAYLQRWLNVKAVWNLTLEENEAAKIQDLVKEHRCGVRFQSVSENLYKTLQAKSQQIIPACGHAIFAY